MKKLLPKSSKGFTLIELLVVVAIIAILTLIAISTYAGVVKKGRDSRRQEEIDSLAKSIEVRKDASSGNYVYDPTSFDQDYPTQNKKPADPQGVTSYCISTSATPISGKPDAASWLTGCPSGPGTWSALPTCPPSPASCTGLSIASLQTPGQKHWMICAKLEASVDVFCKADLSN